MFHQTCAQSSRPLPYYNYYNIYLKYQHHNLLDIFFSGEFSLTRSHTRWERSSAISPKNRSTFARGTNETVLGEASGKNIDGKFLRDVGLVGNWWIWDAIWILSEIFLCLFFARPEIFPPRVSEFRKEIALIQSLKFECKGAVPSSFVDSAIKRANQVESLFWCKEGMRNVLQFFSPGGFEPPLKVANFHVFKATSTFKSLCRPKWKHVTLKNPDPWGRLQDFIVNNKVQKTFTIYRKSYKVGPKTQL